MASKLILSLLREKTLEERQRFFISLANNVCLQIRVNLALGAAESNEQNRTILLNECVHRFLNHALSLYEKAPCWRDREVFEHVKQLAEGDATIINDIGTAISLTSLAKQ